MTESSTAGTDRTSTLLRKRGIRKRMQCSGQVASQIEDAFVTVEQLVDAIESDEELTERDGIGPKTGETIEEWWENRFEREEKMTAGDFERTGAKTATIHFHNSWSKAIGERSVDTGTEQSPGGGSR